MGDRLPLDEEGEKVPGVTEEMREIVRAREIEFRHRAKLKAEAQIAETKGQIAETEGGDDEEEAAQAALEAQAEEGSEDQLQDGHGQGYEDQSEEAHPPVEAALPNPEVFALLSGLLEYRRRQR